MELAVRFNILLVKHSVTMLHVIILCCILSVTQYEYA